MEAIRFLGVGALAITIAAVSLGGCEKKGGEDTTTPKPAAGKKVGMPNRASVYCVEENGKLEIRKGPGGGEYGVCVFKDGSECDEWKLYRGECKAGEAR